MTACHVDVDVDVVVDVVVVVVVVVVVGNQNVFSYCDILAMSCPSLFFNARY